uniref:ATP synthase complex subunit 8 n=1 Tax=Megabeleses liriodendrovorax TaxID=2735432 RepID=A0A8F0WGV6_9HYME|nr:ATP synthase F0 subunit 8 [Megabeleses liriodendrovorax]QWM93814.1 ATP synthase F0 subunit 8 [Megabeleses liriodendrovorax]
MPQMNPMNWMFLYSYFFLAFSLFNIMSYFNFTLLIKNKNFKMKNYFKTSKLWSW